jgi:ribosomal protein L11 methyltransferase
MEYVCVSFKVNPPEPGSEILASALSAENFESFVHNDEGFDAFVQQPLFDETILKNLSEQFPEIKFTHVVSNIKQENWNATWEKSFNPVIIENFCSIRAPFHPAPTPPLLDIIIEPKMSFGTGHHATTWLMSKALFNIPVAGKDILDVGCGTGVLSIIAKKLGAKRVVGVDIDEWSIENSCENRESNGFTPQDIDFLQDTIKGAETNFNIILANINKNILIRELNRYAKHLLSDGKLLISGFFESDCTELIAEAAKHDLKHNHTEVKNEWAVLYFTK